MSRRRPVLHLHVGPHRTGTAAFQEALKKQHRRLCDQGICVYLEPVNNRRSANAVKFAHAFLRPQLLTSPRFAGKIRPPTAFARRLAVTRLRLDAIRHKCDMQVLSAEAFSFARTQQEADWLKTALRKYDVRVVVIRRNETDWRRSWLGRLAGKHDQQQKMALLPESDRIDGDWYFDSNAILRFWQQIGTVTEIDYDKSVSKDGSIIPAILDAMHIDEPSIDLKLKKNVSRASQNIPGK